MKDNRKERKERSKLIIDGNAFYELDLDCVRCREARRKEKENFQKDGEKDPGSSGHRGKNMMQE